MSKRVILMANDTPGLEVTKHLVEHGDTIVRLYLHSGKFCKRGEEIRTASCCPDGAVFEDLFLKDPNHVAGLNEIGPDFIITVYWRHLLAREVLTTAKQGTVNFHPALLPIGRGWYPHVHSIINGTPTGVTLHAMIDRPDAGPIWAQKEVPLSPYDTAYTIYMRLQREIVELFRETWPKIAAGEATPVPQDDDKAVYYPKKLVDSLDPLDPNGKMTVRDLIDRLRARSFGDLGFAFTEEGGQRVYLNLRLSRDIHFRNRDAEATGGNEDTDARA